jgi:hypothetical protein
MMTEHRRIARLLVLISIVFVLAFARQGRLIGKVVDPGGRFVVGVMVIMTSTEIADFRPVATTDEKNLFTMDFPQMNVVYLYQLEKAGYVPLRIEQK